MLATTSSIPQQHIPGPFLFLAYVNCFLGACKLLEDDLKIYHSSGDNWVDQVTDWRNDKLRNSHEKCTTIHSDPSWTFLLKLRDESRLAASGGVHESVCKICPTFTRICTAPKFLLCVRIKLIKTLSLVSYRVDSCQPISVDFNVEPVVVYYASIWLSHLHFTTAINVEKASSHWHFARII